MKKVILVLAVISLSACSPNNVKREAGDALVRGDETGNFRILIRSIDNGNVLWISEYELGTVAAVPHGIHKLSVMCEIIHSAGKRLVPASFEFDFKPNIDYRLSGKLSDDEERCELSIREEGR